ncbi:Shugoshin [Hyphodiscus hymeniophilus]|uniref:Shugoshin n=1 Tax=Hyphodiscus hymeniophilus TaxID=353542 RepID=A0A9P7B175_9HELO|nr:Shugoshin [Hyphodiscus hymeniophilus]
MARLNEPTSAPTESIESLKRKFMRQNRDIARANSTQSLRIRNLENETSRLLAENLGLREQILQLQNELENGKAQRIADHTCAIKSQLEAKLLEIGTLITGLGDGPVAKKSSRREGKITSPTKSPGQRNWKNMCTLSEAVEGQEGRLPPILENKSYPRRTLELQELAEMVTENALDTTDSPEIGPPPVSQFVDEDPVKIDLPTRPKRHEPEELSSLDPTLSVSIEQRRKRRDSSVSSDSRRSSNVDPGTKETATSLKTGAKRKLSVRDDEEQTSVAKPAVDNLDEFNFTRVTGEGRSKSMPQAERSGSKVARELAIARGVPKEKASASAAPSSRKVLAPKSVNNSPRKNSRPLTYDESKVMKGDAAKGGHVKDHQRDNRHDPVSIKPITADLHLQTIEVQPEPETPVGLDLFSPTSSQQSTARNETRDTPPPPDIGVDGQRPSRRARPAVSYAEPSLRDKMRRPTKELVDAVVPGTVPLRASTIKSEGHDSGSSVKIKSEHEANDEWKRMPVASSATVENSPLSGKVAGPESLSSSITTHRKRRESLLAENDIPRTGSVSAIAAILAGNRRVRSDGQERSLEQENIPSKSSTTHDIYDFKGSSPAPAEEDVGELAKEEKQVPRYSRRRSSMARDMPPVYDSESSDPEGSKKPDLSKSRRRQSTLGLRASSAGATLSKEKEAEKILKRASSTIDTSNSGSIVVGSDRVSARRRSMML